MPDDYQKFTAPGAGEELHQSHVSTFAMGTSPEDGLPTLIAPQHFDKAPGLSEETLICMADKRSFVIRDVNGVGMLSFQPEAVSRSPNGRYFVTSAVLADQLLKKKTTVEAVYGAAGAVMAQTAVTFEVEPIRPECKHYLRSMTDIASNRDGRFYQRACMAQKSEEGEYYSLRDARVDACNIRSPRHIESEALMDAFDAELMAAARERSEMEDFDIDQELAKEQGKLGVLG